MNVTRGGPCTEHAEMVGGHRSVTSLMTTFWALTPLGSTHGYQRIGKCI